MVKDAYYFPHFCNARHDRKLKRVTKQLGVEGYGIYFMVLEVLREQTDYRYPISDIDLLADEFGTSDVKVSAVIKNYELFIIDNEMFFSQNLINNMQPYLIMKEQRSLAGKASAEKRKQLTQFNDRSTTVEQSKVKESKVKEIKVNSDFYIFRLEQLENLNRETYDKLKTDYAITEPIVYNHKTKHPITEYDLVEHLALAIESDEWKQSLITRFGKNKKFSKAMVDYFNLLKTNYEYLEFKDTFDFRKYFANWFNTKKENY